MAFDEELGYDPDKSRPEGDYEDGVSVRYSENWYRFDFGGELVSVVRITMRITGGSWAGGQTIHRYLTYKERMKVKNSGGDRSEIFDAAETHDDMEYFMRRLKAEEAKGNWDYQMP